MATIGGKRMIANPPAKKSLPDGYSIAEGIMSDRAKRGRAKDNATLEKGLKKDSNPKAKKVLKKVAKTTKKQGK